MGQGDDRKRGRLHGTSDAVLRRAGDRPDTASDRRENAEIARELAAAERESSARGDTAARLDDWRRAERASDVGDPESDEGVGLRGRAGDARDAFHEAEDAQRQRHGYKRRARQRGHD